MDLTKKSRDELITICKEKGVKGYSGKKKNEILLLLETPLAPVTGTVTGTVTESVKEVSKETPEKKITRLNYIGSKFQLLDWLTSIILDKTTEPIKSFTDLFAGTGVVSYHFRKLGAKVISNDAELYSSIITHAFSCSTFTPECKTILSTLQKELEEKKYESKIGFITKHYSPYEGNERKFFTVDNAKRIDYMRERIEEIKSCESVGEDEYKFLLASLLISADAVSNVPAVYGCYLKNFKAKALKPLTLNPIHSNTIPITPGSITYNNDVLNVEFLRSLESDVVYLDPPYNERQYSKNYFPLNIIAKTPEELETEPPLKGKTGIPQDCFISPFCKKGSTVENAFDTLFKELRAKWIFLSYNSESIVSKEKMLEIMNKYGKATVEERDYKRFKSFEYNDDKEIKEYLFCLELRSNSN
jgi:adenine-specific DNA-methyltransferase